jgi:hypothetical protein
MCLVAPDDMPEQNPNDYQPGEQVLLLKAILDKRWQLHCHSIHSPVGGGAV